MTSSFMSIMDDGQSIVLTDLSKELEECEDLEIDFRLFSDNSDSGRLIGNIYGHSSIGYPEELITADFADVLIPPPKA